MNTPGSVRLALALISLAAAAPSADTNLGSFLVTNNDVAPPFINTASIFPVNPDGSLGTPATVETLTHGIEGGFFASSRVLVQANGSDACIYVSDAYSGDIAGVDAATQSVTGNFYGSDGDSGMANGIGLAANAQFLYASYSSSATIATFQVNSGCTLSFAGDILVNGLNAGIVGGMAVRDNLLVVTYGDGSIESFDISGGIPVSNGDLQNSTGSADDHLPNGVTITHDGHFAIFGDASTRTTVEVSDISSGKLTTTVAYALGSGWNSSNVTLSPDESILYISNGSSGKVTVAFFNPTTGKVKPGCTSDSLTGFYSKFSYLGNIDLQLTSGAGGRIYAPEYSGNGRLLIGMLSLSVNGNTCTLTETSDSPVSLPGTFAYGLSLAMYPGAQ